MTQPVPGPPRRSVSGPLVALLSTLAVVVLGLSAAFGYLVLTDSGPFAGSAPEVSPARAGGSQSGGTDGSAPCWDGSTADGPDTCPELSGNNALTWLYGTQELDCQVVGSNLRPSLSAGLDCKVKDDPQTVVYLTQWKSQQVAEDELDLRYPDTPTTADGIRTYRDDVPDSDRTRITLLYDEQPFSMAVEADSVSARDAALAQVSYRSAQEATESGAVPAVQGGAIECWDSTGADTSAECPELTGQAALEWVFADPTLKTCSQVPPPPSAVARVRCTQEGSADVEVYLTQWSSLPNAQGYLNGYGVQPEAAAPGRIWHVQQQDGRQLREWLYDDLPYSLAVVAPSVTQASQTLTGLSARSTEEITYRAQIPGI